MTKMSDYEYYQKSVSKFFRLKMKTGSIATDLVFDISSGLKVWAKNMFIDFLTELGKDSKIPLAEKVSLMGNIFSRNF